MLVNAVLLFFCYLFLFSFSPVFEAEANGKGEINLARILSHFEQKLIDMAHQKGIPGFAAGVVYQGNVVYTKCFGVRSIKTKAPITPATVFQLGSISKAITGTLMGMLHQKKLLQLDDKVATYIPSFSYQPNRLTLRHILTHTSGLPRYGFNALVESERLKRSQIFDRLQKVQGTCLPGKCYDYHNVAYSLSAPVVEAVTGKTYEEALKVHVFEPLGMVNASASFEGINRLENRASPHQKTRTGYIVSPSYRKGYYEVAPSGGVNASLSDMCTFLAAHMGTRQDILAPQTLAMLHTAYTPTKDILEKNPVNIKRFKGSFYGVGWRILDYEGHKIVFHGGWIKGFVNIIAFIPEKQVGVVILQNTETSFPWMMAMNFIDNILGIEGRDWARTPVSQNVTHRIAHNAVNKKKSRHSNAKKKNRKLKEKHRENKKTKRARIIKRTTQNI